MNYYKILGLSSSAEACVIKAAYRALSKKYHPDKFDGDEKESHDKMAKINEAYSTLKDKNKKKAYDNEHPGGAEETSQYSTDDWSVVVSYYPLLKNYVAIAQSIDYDLGSLLISSLLKTKRYQEAREITRDIISSQIEYELGECSHSTKASYIYCKIHNNIEAANVIKNRVRVLHSIDMFSLSTEDRQAICDSMGIVLLSEESNNSDAVDGYGIKYKRLQRYTTPDGTYSGLSDALFSVVASAYPELLRGIEWVRGGMSLK